MQTPEDRRQWIDDTIDGRTFGSQLSVWSYPEQSAKDVALHEALYAFVGGLFLSTVLNAYAACEISLVETLVSRSVLPELSSVRDGEDLARIWEASMADGQRMGRTKAILRALRDTGHWLPPTLRNRLIELGDHKNDLGHYRPSTISDIQPAGDSAWTAMSMAAPAAVDPAVRFEYAKHGIETMLDLWFGQVWSFNPGECPDDSWVPPSI